MGLPGDDPAWSAREIGFGALDRLGEAALARDDNERAEEPVHPGARHSPVTPYPDAALARVQVRRAAARVALHRLRRRGGRSRAGARARGTCGPGPARSSSTARSCGVRGDDGAGDRGTGVGAGGGERVRLRPGRRRGAAAARADRLPRRPARRGRRTFRAGAERWRSGSVTGAARAGRCSTWPGARRPGATTPRPSAGWPPRPTCSPASTTTVGCRGAPAPRRSSGCCRGASSRPATSRRACCRSGARSGDRWGTAACLTIDAFAAAELGQITTALEESANGYDEFAALGDTWGVCLASIASGVALRGAGAAHARRFGDSSRPSSSPRKGHQPMPGALAIGAIGYCRLDLGDAERCRGGREAGARR